MFEKKKRNGKANRNGLNYVAMQKNIKKKTFEKYVLSNNNSGTLLILNFRFW